MLKRFRWMATGFVLGFLLALWLTRTMRQATQRYSPERLTSTVKGVGTDVRTAVSEGRAAMRQREAELRQRLAEPRPGP